MRTTLGCWGRIALRLLPVITSLGLIFPSVSYAQNGCAATNITSITPGTWFAGKEYQVNIVGTGFAATPPEPWCTATSVTVDVDQGEVHISHVTIVNDTLITATIKPGEGVPLETACVYAGELSFFGPIQPANATANDTASDPDCSGPGFATAPLLPAPKINGTSKSSALSGRMTRLHRMR